MKPYQQLCEFNVDAIRPCKYFRKDTGQCTTGCPKSNVQKGNVCPYEVEAYDKDDLLQTECGCYK